MKHISHRKPSQTTGMLHLANPLIPCNFVPVWQRYKSGLYTMDQVYICACISLHAASQFAYSWVSSLLQQQFNRNKNVYCFSFFPSVVYLSPPTKKMKSPFLGVFHPTKHLPLFSHFHLPKATCCTSVLQSQGWTVGGVTFMRTCSWTNSGFSNPGVQPLCRVITEYSNQ